MEDKLCCVCGMKLGWKWAAPVYHQLEEDKFLCNFCYSQGLEWAARMAWAQGKTFTFDAGKKQEIPK